MARDVDAERLFTDKKFRPARRDGLILLVDRDVDGREERGDAWWSCRPGSAG